MARRRTSRSASLGVAVLLGAALAGCYDATPDARTGRPGSTASPSTSAAGGADAAAAKAGKVAASLSDTDLVGQVLVPELYGENATKVTAAAAKANLRLAGVSTPAEIVAKFRLGGIILANRTSADPTASTNTTTNIASASQVRALNAGLQTAAAKLPVSAPLLIGTDQEYGVVTRLRSR